MRKTIVILFHLLFLTVPLFFSSKTDELFEFDKMILTYGIALLIGGLWIGRMVVEKRWIFRKTPFDLPLALFVASQILSTMFSINPHTSIYGYYSRFNGGLLSVITYVGLFYALVNNVKPSEVRALIRTLLYSALLVCLYAIPEHFGHSPSCYFISKKFNVECWVQDVKSRVFGTFGQPNWLAAYLIMVIPIAIAEGLVFWKNMAHRIQYLVLFVIYFSTLLFTGSRSGLASLALGFLVFGSVLLAFGRKRIEWKTLASSGAIFGTLMLLLFTIFGGAFTQSFRYLTGKYLSFMNKAETTQRDQASPATPAGGGTQLEVGGTESGTIRKIVWEGAIKVWQRYPIFGSGVETFAYSYYKDRPMAHNAVSEWDFLYNKAHNEFLNYLATTGVVGFLSYVCLIISIYTWTLKHAKHAPCAAASWLAAFTGLHVSNFLGFSTVIVSTLFFLTPAFLFLELDLSVDEKQKHHGGSWNILQWIGLGGTSIVTLFLLMQVSNMWRADVAYANGKKLKQQGLETFGTQSFTSLQKAVSIMPNEPVFHDELAYVSSQLTILAAIQKNAELAQQYGEFALKESELTLRLNPWHLNFYMSRTQMLISLARVAPPLLKDALATLEKAQEIAPTHPKVTYNRAIITSELGDKEKAVSLLQEALRMKPDYGAAKDQLERLQKEGEK